MNIEDLWNEVVAVKNHGQMKRKMRLMHLARKIQYGMTLIERNWIMWDKNCSIYVQ